MEYTFSPNGFSSTLVLPPSEAADSRPLYYISAALDVFIPTAGMTTVCRGGHPDGDYVGDFECALRPLLRMEICSHNSGGGLRVRSRRSRWARDKSKLVPR